MDCSMASTFLTVSYNSCLLLTLLIFICGHEIFYSYFTNFWNNLFIYTDTAKNSSTDYSRIILSKKLIRGLGVYPIPNTDDASKGDFYIFNNCITFL